MNLDLTELPKGKRYEDRYGGYLKLFYEISQCPDDDVIVENAPASWYPLLFHLRCKVLSLRRTFQHCQHVEQAVNGYTDLDRTTVEVLAAFRPEVSDALWKCDMQWMLHPKRVREYEKQDVFVVNVNGAWHRREVMDYMYDAVGTYKPKKKNVVLVPCAADKPYPAKMHQAVLDLLPDDFYLMNVTGVLGLVPQELWGVMPHYDCGVPNDWRVFHAVRNYFAQWHHDRIVVYLDYYNLAVYHGLKSINEHEKAAFINDLKFYFDYLDLMDEKRLLILDKVLRDPSFPLPEIIGE